MLVAFPCRKIMIFTTVSHPRTIITSHQPTITISPLQTPTPTTTQPTRSQANCTGTHWEAALYFSQLLCHLCGVRMIHPISDGQQLHATLIDCLCLELHTHTHTHTHTHNINTHTHTTHTHTHTQKNKFRE